MTTFSASVYEIPWEIAKKLLLRSFDAQLFQPETQGTWKDADPVQRFGSKTVAAVEAISSLTQEQP